tara:strand:- start:6950 stop:8707 length:1758 start_codon:yes stop_codon:yes gene_type:complete
MDTLFSRFNFDAESIPLNYDKIGRKQNVLEKLAVLNEQTDHKIELSENLSFKPGTYKKFQEMVINKMFPTWSGKANNLRKLLQWNPHNVSHLREDLESIDNNLRRLRREGFTLSSNEKEKYQLALKNWIGAVNKTTVDLPIDIKIGTNALAWHPGSPWIGDYPANNTISLSNPATVIRNHETSTFQTNRTRSIDHFIYVNVEITFPDLNINFRQGEFDKFKTNIGTLKVYLTYELGDLLNQIVATSKKYGLVAWAELFPVYPEIWHPFVSSHGWYQNGNICWGGFIGVINKAFKEGDMDKLYRYVAIWAQTYNLSGTTPLNQPQDTYFHVSEEDKDKLSRYKTLSPSHCERATDKLTQDLYRPYNSPQPIMSRAEARKTVAQEFIGNECMNCWNIDSCNVFVNLLNYVENVKLHVDIILELGDTMYSQILTAIQRSIMDMDRHEFSGPFRITKFLEEWQIDGLGNGHQAYGNLIKLLALPARKIDINGYQDIYCNLERIYYVSRLDALEMNQGLINQATHELRLAYRIKCSSENVVPVYYESIVEGNISVPLADYNWLDDRAVSTWLRERDELEIGPVTSPETTI